MTQFRSASRYSLPPPFRMMARVVSPNTAFESGQESGPGMLGYDGDSGNSINSLTHRPWTWRVDLVTSTRDEMWASQAVVDRRFRSRFSSD